MFIKQERSEPSVKELQRERRRRPSRRRLLWIVLAFVLPGIGVALLVTAEILVHRAAPILRARVIDTLSTRFDSRVELAEFDVSVWKGIEVTGKGLKLYPRALAAGANPDRPNRDQPIFAVGQFRFRTHWWSLLRSPMHISEVRLSDLEVYRPTKGSARGCRTRPRLLPSRAARATSRTR